MEIDHNWDAVDSIHFRQLSISVIVNCANQERKLTEKRERGMSKIFCQKRKRFLKTNKKVNWMNAIWNAICWCVVFCKCYDAFLCMQNRFQMKLRQTNAYVTLCPLIHKVQLTVVRVCVRTLKLRALINAWWCNICALYKQNAYFYFFLFMTIFVSLWSSRWSS